MIFLTKWDTAGLQERKAAIVSASTLTEIEKNGRDRAKQQFEIWLEQPLSRLCISMIPANKEYPETLVELLRSAFCTGFDAGMAHSMIEIIAQLAKRQPKKS
ncbi:MAG TPA: hypothetical protein VE986_05415 [Hyphomicrobiales bacterium]|nr:hypothetical protein [Hyphomicrobiales bacterium]